MSIRRSKILRRNIKWFYLGMDNNRQMILEIVEIVSQTAITTLTNQNIKYQISEGRRLYYKFLGHDK